MASETANKLSHQLDELNYLAEKARLDRRIFNKYKDLIEKSRQHFAQELNSIVPGIDINAKDKSLTNDELNALIAHAYLRVDQLRQQLIEQQVCFGYAFLNVEAGKTCTATCLNIKCYICKYLQGLEVWGK